MWHENEVFILGGFIHSYTSKEPTWEGMGARVPYLEAKEHGKWT
jgi:hypothetical protein